MLSFLLVTTCLSAFGSLTVMTIVLSSNPQPRRSTSTVLKDRLPGSSR